VFSCRTLPVLLFSVSLLGLPAFASHVHRAPTAGQVHHTRQVTRRVTRRASHRIRGQQAIEPERVTQIQQALIRVHYLNGEATGNWDPTTIAAMQKFQADQGWQTKLMPDSRALEKLGLGPDYSTAINAKTAQLAPSAPETTTPAGQMAGFEAASGVNE
jgi:peptidoglycan hydrolase-like protein with peptidoglycan-binding domain